MPSVLEVSGGHGSQSHRADGRQARSNRRAQERCRQVARTESTSATKPRPNAPGSKQPDDLKAVYDISLRTSMITKPTKVFHETVDRRWKIGLPPRLQLGDYHRRAPRQLRSKAIAVVGKDARRCDEIKGLMAAQDAANSAAVAGRGKRELRLHGRKLIAVELATLTAIFSRSFTLFRSFTRARPRPALYPPVNSCGRGFMALGSESGRRFSSRSY